MRPSLLYKKKRIRKKRKPGQQTEANAAFKRANESLARRVPLRQSGRLIP